jgi:hypothetical protein
MSAIGFTAVGFITVTSFGFGFLIGGIFVTAVYVSSISKQNKRLRK